MEVYNGGNASTWNEQDWLDNGTASGTNDGLVIPSYQVVPPVGPKKGWRGYAPEHLRAHRRAMSDQLPIFKRPARAFGFPRRTRRHAKR